MRRSFGDTKDCISGPARTRRERLNAQHGCVLVLGVGISSFPTRLADAVSEYFGVDRAGGLIGKVDALIAEASIAPSDWGSMTLVDATMQVRIRVGLEHPELSPDAVEALAWHFSYANK